jgi:hypothetical protein
VRARRRYCRLYTLLSRMVALPSPAGEDASATVVGAKMSAATLVASVGRRRPLGEESGSAPGNKPVAGHDVSQWVLGSFGDANSRCDCDLRGVTAVVHQREIRLRVNQVLAIISGSGNPKCFTEPSRAAGQLPCLVPTGCVRLKAASASHKFRARERLQCADQHAT